jgi:hypothetical protein
VVCALVQHLVIDVHFLEVEWDVLLRFPANLLLELRGGHQRHRDLLDDYAVTARPQCNVTPLRVGEQQLEALDDGARVDDVPIDDGFGRKRMETKPCDGSCPPAPLFDFTDFNRARTDVDAD